MAAPVIRPAAGVPEAVSSGPRCPLKGRRKLVPPVLSLLAASLSLALCIHISAADGEQPSRRPRRIAALSAASATGRKVPTGIRGVPDRQVARRPRYSAANALRYFNGPLVVNPSPVHVIYYGNWANGTRARLDRAQIAIRRFIASISSTNPVGPGSVSRWWKINSLLAQRDNRLVTNRVFLASEQYDWYSQGKALRDDSLQIFRVVKRLFDLKRLAPNPGAMYAVLTSPDVSVGSTIDGFCIGYCGWHDFRKYLVPKTNRTVNIFYAFVGNPATQCLSTCGTEGPSANGNPGIDAMVDVLGHELSEIATDPDGETGWITDPGESGQENADLCRKNYLGVKYGFTGRARYQYNLLGVNGSRFLVQSNYNPVRATCTMVP